MIRKANLLDAVKLNQLTIDEIEMDVDLTVTESQLIKMMNDPEHHLILVYEDSETREVSGYVHAQVYETLFSRPIFHIVCLAACFGEERHSIGETLLNVLEGEAIKRQYAAIEMSASEHRFEMHHFLERVGYQTKDLNKTFVKYFK